MASDIFLKADAKKLLRGKSIYFFGDSNTRAVYKDLLWLLEDGRIIPDTILKTKNEISHANDTRLSHGQLHNGRNYEEIREYNENVYIKFQFITRLYLPEFVETIKNVRRVPDIVVLNSGVWDLTRWGSDGVSQFKANIYATLKFLKTELPSTRIIWVTSLPPDFNCRGGFLTQEVEFTRNMLPWHIMFANKYASDVAKFLQVDVLDLHYQFQFLGHHHTKDGIHWAPATVRYATNLFLTHVALLWKFKLPNESKLDKNFLKCSQEIYNERNAASVSESQIWYDTDTNGNRNDFSKQLKIHRRPEAYKNSTDRFQNKQYQSRKNTLNYNYDSSRQDRARKNILKNVQNPGRVDKRRYLKKQDSAYAKKYYFYERSNIH